MNHIKKMIVCAFAAAAVSLCYGVESANVIIKLKDGKVMERTVKAVKVAEGVNRITVPADSVPEGFEYLDIVADNAVARKGEEGFWIFSRGEMGTFRVDNGVYYRGRSPLPIYGMKNPRETFVAIIKGMEIDKIYYVQAVNGVYKIFPRWKSAYSGDKIYEDISIDFITLTGDDANYSGMGRAYRKYQLENKVVETFKDKIKNGSPLRQEALRGIATAMAFRIEPHGQIPGKRNNPTVYTSATVPQVKPIITFAQSKELVKAIKDAGMDDVHFISGGWQSGGYGGACPQIFPIDECLGGLDGLKDFIKYTQSLGYQICPNANHTDAFTNSYMWSPEYVAKKRDGSFVGEHRVNIMGWMHLYYINVKKCRDRFIKAQIDQTRELGFKGAYYIDVYSACPPFPSYEPEGYVSRTEMAKYQNIVLAYAKEKFGAAASECGFDHCIQNLDYVNYQGRYMLYGEGKADVGKIAGKHIGYNKLIDRVAPLWEIVYHGIVLSNPDKFTQQFLRKGSDAYLRLIEFGGRPIFYAHDYSPKAIARYKAMYDAFQPLKHLQLELMEENRELAPKVFLTRYGDGSETVVNYTDAAFAYKGVEVPARDYKLFSPKK